MAKITFTHGSPQGINPATQVTIENGDAATVAEVARQLGFSLEATAVQLNRQPASPNDLVRNGDLLMTIPNNQKAA
jgi:sulfur carrier protein ThiS